MRPALFLVLLSINCDSSPQSAEDIELRDTTPCKIQAAMADDMGLSEEQRNNVVSCCNDVGGQCNCASEFIDTCDTYADCNAAARCVAGWCVKSDQCGFTPWGGHDGSLCQGTCQRGDQEEPCATHLACWDPISELCMPCQVCEECGPGCDVTSQGLACTASRVAPMYSCAQIVALRYEDDKAGQWIQVRNMCAEQSNIISGLKIGTANGWTDVINTKIPALQPGQCHIVWNPKPAIKNPTIFGVAEGVGLFSYAVLKTGKIPRDYVLYGYYENLLKLTGVSGIPDEFGFGGWHSSESHANRTGFKTWGTAASNQPPSCQ